MSKPAVTAIPLAALTAVALVRRGSVSKRSLAVTIALGYYTARFLRRVNVLVLYHRGQWPLWRVLRRAAVDAFAGIAVALSELAVALRHPQLAYAVLWRLVSPRVQRSLTYGPRPRNMLDVFAPACAGPRNRGVVVFVHGGAWAWGHHWQYAHVGKWLAEQGYVGVTVGMSVYPNGDVDDMHEDLLQALEWVAMHAAEWGARGDALAVMGHSAGAHLCALVLARGAYRSGADARAAARIAAFVGVSGVYDVAAHYKHEQSRVVGPLAGVHNVSPLRPAMRRVSQFAAASPTSLVAGWPAPGDGAAAPRWPPTLLLHGDADEVVPVSSSRGLCEALARAQPHATALCELQVFQGASHTDTIIQLAQPRARWHRPLREHITTFLDRALSLHQPV